MAYYNYARDVELGTTTEMMLILAIEPKYPPDTLFARVEAFDYDVVALTPDGVVQTFVVAYQDPGEYVVFMMERHGRKAGLGVTSALLWVHRIANSLYVIATEALRENLHNSTATRIIDKDDIRYTAVPMALFINWCEWLGIIELE